MSLLMQAVIEAGIIAPLVNLLQNAECDIKKEAAWAISNATSGGSPDQIKYEKFIRFVSLFHYVYFLDLIAQVIIVLQVFGESGMHQAIV